MRSDLERVLNGKIGVTLKEALEGENRWLALALHVAAARIMEQRGMVGLQTDLEHYTLDE